MRSFALASCAVLLLVGCGSRTGLPWGNDDSPFGRYDLGDGEEAGSGGSGGSGGSSGASGAGAGGSTLEVPDGGPGGAAGAGGSSIETDAGVPDADGPDADEPELDAGADAEPDADEPDADVPDAEPDADVPDADIPDAEPDAEVPDADVPDVVKLGCDSPNETQIYAITIDQELLSFYPPTGTFSLIAKLDCPSISTPYSMAVARNGVAYSVFLDGDLFRINTSKGTCAATPYVPNQQGFTRYGMGFSSDENVDTESLFIVSSAAIGDAPHLGRLDLDSLTIGGVVHVAPELTGMELTGTGDGRLYGFVADPSGIGTRLVQLDKDTGMYVTEADFPSLPLGNGWAFSFWGGDFWFFTSVGSSAIVTRYEPTTKTLTQVASWPSRIVGAGVSTCAPEN